MNRAERRRKLREKELTKREYESQKNQFKGKISDKQFEKFFGEEQARLIDEEAEKRVRLQVNNYWVNIETHLKKAMRENRISDERIQKVFERFAQLVAEEK